MNVWGRMMFPISCKLVQRKREFNIEEEEEEIQKQL
jgi:hypothetical protein